MKPSARFTIGRSLAALWRFNGLTVAHRVFRPVETSTILERRFFDHNLYLDVVRTDTHRLLYLEGARFIQERYLIADLVRPGDTAIDVGANIGYYTLMLSSLVGPTGQVLCFEPEPDNLSELRRNVHLNKLANVKVIEAAVGETNGQCHLTRGINGMVCENGNSDLEVKIVALDSVIDLRIDLLKIDVEGYEGHVLAGAERLIREHRPAMFVEVHPTLLTNRYTVSNILNFASQFYEKIELYDVEESGLIAKVASRYFGKPIIRSIKDTADALSRSGNFWMVCR